MSTSYHAIGQREEDEEFQKHMAVWKACDDADVDLPEQTKKYLGEAADYEKYDSVRTRALEINMDDAVSQTGCPGTVDHVVDLSKLPDGVKKIIFRVSW